MESDHYTIPGYQECIEQASATLRHELEALHQLQPGHRSGVPAERLEAMVAWRLTLLNALTEGG